MTKALIFITLISSLQIIKTLEDCYWNEPIPKTKDTSELNHKNGQEPEDEEHETITQNQINKIKQQFINKHNPNYAKIPSEIFSNKLLQNLENKIDLILLLEDTKIKLTNKLIPHTHNLNINHERILRILILSVFCISYTNILQKKSDEDLEYFLKSIYDSLNSKQKTLITNQLHQSFKEKLGYNFIFNLVK